jgi:hypothetical protein
MPRGITLTFTYNTVDDNPNDVPNGVPFPRVTMDASALKRGDVVALYPHPNRDSAMVLTRWTHGTVETDGGTFDLSPTSQVTVTRLAR